MKILLTPPKTETFARFFPERLINRLQALGELVQNETGRQLTKQELAPLLQDIDVVLTHWGSVQYDEALLSQAPKLKVLAHCAGTVAHIASEAFYDRGIPVLSANPIMAKYVAEWVLGAMIASLHRFPGNDDLMRRGLWRTETAQAGSLFGADIGLVGLGAVGRELLELLRPFRCRVGIYDPYLRPEALAPWPFAALCSFEEAMAKPIVSIHASQTPETYHMINAATLSKMPDGALLINSARGSLVDTEALITELETGRLFAALDVFEKEGCSQDPRLLTCKENTILQPHTAAIPAGSSMTEAMIDDLERFSRGEPMKLTVSRAQYLRMTQE